MKRFLAAVLLVGVLSAPTSAEAHAISCAAYVGNEQCFQQAYWHNWWHRFLANPLGLGR